MSDIKIHVFHTGEVCVAPDLPFGGENCNAVKASGVFGKKEDRLWLPVSAYLIEHPKGKLLVDTGWARDMSPNGEFDKKAQIKSLGSVVLYEVNQGRITVYVCAADLSVVDAAYEVFDFTLENNLKIDVLINNAGFGDAGAFAERDWQRHYEMVQLNVVALMQITHLFLKPMKEQGHGKIMNLSSVAAFCAGPDMSIYYATKAFVRSFSEAVAEEVKGTGITVTAVCPGPTATGFEKAADMGNKSTMFRFAKNADRVAIACYDAMQNGKVLLYEGAFVKLMNIGSRIAPRSITRKFAQKMNH